MSTQTVALVDFTAFTDYTRDQIDLVKNTVARGASDDELKLFLLICKRTQLDPFAKQIYCVKRWDSNLGKHVMTPQTGIDGLRLIAERTGKYIGQTEPMWCGEDGIWKDVWLSKEHPSAAKVGVYKEGFPHPFMGVVKYDEYVQTFRKDGKEFLSPFWSRSPSNQLAKCGEAQALRKAFPNETCHLMIAEELSTMDEATEDDFHRVEKLNSPMGDFVVKPKVSTEPAAPAPQDAPPEASQPVREAAAPTPAPTTPAPHAEAPAAPDKPKRGKAPAKAPPVVYEIWYAKNDKAYPCPDEQAHPNLDVAALRAQALATETGLEHVVYAFDKDFEDRKEQASFQPGKTQAKPEQAKQTEPEKPTPAPTGNSLKDRLTARQLKLAEILKLAPKTAFARFSTFFCGYMGAAKAADLPKEIEAYVDAVEDMESLINSDPKVFAAGPAEAGRTLAKRNAAIREHMTTLNWPEKLISLALVPVRRNGMELEDFQGWVHTMGLVAMRHEDVIAYYRALIVNKDAAVKLLRLQKDNNLSMEKVLSQVEERALLRKVEDAPPESVYNAVLAYSRTVQEEIAKLKEKNGKATPPAPATEKEPAPKEPEEEEGGNWNLFG